MVVSGKPEVSTKGILPSPAKNGETIVTQNMEVGEFIPFVHDWEIFMDYSHMLLKQRVSRRRVGSFGFCLFYFDLIF